METLMYPPISSSLFSNSGSSNLCWLIQDSKNNISTTWSKEENKKFERALAIYDDKTPDRWVKVAAMLPGKSVLDVIKQYKELEEDVCDIEAGLVPLPGYPTPAASSTTTFTLEYSFDNRSKLDSTTKKKSSLLSSMASRPVEHERRKGVPWTEEEHRRFLLGLEKHGKGDWRNISRNFVISKTPTQVASHAQKYFLRQQVSGGGKDKKRPSIHDITTPSLLGKFFQDTNTEPNYHYLQQGNDDENDRSAFQSQQRMKPMAISVIGNNIPISNDDMVASGSVHNKQGQNLYGSMMDHHNGSYGIRKSCYAYGY